MNTIFIESLKKLLRKVQSFKMSRAGGNALMKLLSGDKKKKKTKKGTTEDLGSVTTFCYLHTKHFE